MTDKELFDKAEVNGEFFLWLEDQNIYGDDLAALIWSCPTWGYLDGWFEKIESWFGAPYDATCDWYNTFNCEKYMDEIVALYKLFEKEMKYNEAE